MIKYSELELIELFYEEPKSLTDDELGQYKISRIIDDFELILYLDVYENDCSVLLTYNNADLVSIDIKNVEELSKKDNILYICDAKEVRAKIYFGKNFQIECE